MTASVFLALLFGAYIIVISLAMLFNQNRLIEALKEFIANPALLFLTGILAMMGGISIIFFHNIWTPDWRGLITLLGWIVAIEGALILIAPAPLLKISNYFLEKRRAMTVIALIYLAFGAYLISQFLTHI